MWVFIIFLVSGFLSSACRGSSISTASPRKRGQGSQSPVSLPRPYSPLGLHRTPGGNFGNLLAGRHLAAQATLLCFFRAPSVGPAWR
ncbi:hypothetical protein V8C34DRAFT_269310 [Trichoderma compactum]